tara:strand:- start:1129 stop:2898 length:1770 start_codon:yes stop_codon:yes gene_type:complete
MATLYKYYLNGYEYAPSNEGGFTFDISLDKSDGAHQYITELNGSINFKNAAYDYIMKHGDTQKIELTIKEVNELGTFLIFDLFFTVRDCKINPKQKKIEVSPKQNTLYNCLKNNYDREFNFLEVPTVVNSLYSYDVSQIEFNIFGKDAYNPPFYGSYILCGGVTPLFGFKLFGREKRTTYCNAGKPQTPSGTGWQLYADNCASKNIASYYRKPLTLDDAPNKSCLITFDYTTCSGAGCSAPLPASPLGTENWHAFKTFVNSTGAFAWWVNLNSIPANNHNLNNGRLLTDVINYGLNQNCEALDLQSEFLTNLTNPVTNITPSSTEGLQIHAISDIKDPDASEPASIENITIRKILNDYISSKLNCFWRVDEGTQRLIIEHYTDLNAQGVTDLTIIDSGKWLELKNRYEYDNTDTPKAEAFPSLDSSIDFTGVNIEYDNDAAHGVKTYNTESFYSEVETILNNPQDYPNDGAAIITPLSLAPPESTTGARSELGAITGDYRPNAPQGMANLHKKFWPYYRPFDFGKLNFTNRAFSKTKPVKKLESITVPLCCFFFFAPYSAFKTNDFTNGELQSASFNPKSGFITLEILY